MAAAEDTDTSHFSPAEQLARQFYEWELRGRGWQVWDRPIDIEPPFAPFFGHTTSIEQNPDNGHKHTLISGLFNWLHRRVRGAEDIASSTDELCDPIEPNELEDPDDLTELQIRLPSTLKVLPEITEQFILSLSACGYPPAFEIVGLPDSVGIQFVCSSVDAKYVKQQLEAYFPEATVTAHDNRFSKHWMQVENSESVIAEFGLAREFMLPLGTPSSFSIDPLTSLIAALADVSEDEIGLVQVLFQQVHHPWAESLLRSVTFADGTPFFDSVRDFLKQAQRKASRPLYSAVVRIACRSKSDDRAWQLANRLASALGVFANPEGNELIPLDNEGYDPRGHEQDVLFRRSRRCGMILNSEELSCLVHLPSASVRNAKLRGSEAKTKITPSIVSGHELVLGENNHEGSSRPVTLSPDQRSRHVHLVGASGTGKSTLLLNMILQDIQRGDGVAVLDPHGDLIDDVQSRLPPHRLQDVILLDPSDEEYPMGLNVLSARTATEKNLLASDLVSVFRRLSTSWGDQMTAVLGNAILAVLESSRGGTLIDLRRFLVEQSYRKEFLTSVEDPEVVYYWTKSFPLLSGKPQGPVLTRLDTFLRPRPIRNMVAQKNDRLNFAEIMDRGRIFLARLSHGAIGEENAHFLGTLLVSKFHQIALGRQRQKESERRYFWLYVDEFQNFATPSMASILSGARKYRLGLVLAHQELRQLESSAPAVASAVMANAYTRVCFRLGDQDAKKLESGFAFFEARDLQNLGTGEAICRVERADFDFNLKTIPLPRINAGNADRTREQVISLSRQKYAASRQEVEQYSRKSHTSDEQRNESPTPATTPTEEKQASVVPPVPLPTPVIVEQKTTIPARKAKPDVLANDPPSLGRGGREHKYLQQLIKQWAEGMGYRAGIEESVLGNCAVDVALHKGATNIACEICITTDDEHELGNVLKCLQGGYHYVAAISPDERRLAKLRKAIEPQLADADRSRARFFSPDELFAFLQQLEVEQLSKEQVVRGYKVKTTYKPTNGEDADGRRQAVAQVVAKAMTRMRQQKKQ